MDAETVSLLVSEILASYCFKPTPSGSTVGVPWSAEKVHGYVEQLKKASVKPYRQRFELRETFEQVEQTAPAYADFWVVAEGDAGYVVWYDPANGEFGLGIRAEGNAVPVSIGVRGDLVGVFCAM
ncbi:MAG: hypothetical protein IAF94_12200 [Pirellulaceae bacterium]|nr:hypothetical protein [Pirellulaceae bacterium]